MQGKLRLVSLLFVLQFNSAELSTWGIGTTSAMIRTW